jgi:hypothetical protein
LDSRPGSQPCSGSRARHECRSANMCALKYIYILYYIISKYIIDVWICGYMRVKYALIMHFLVWNICFRSSIIHTSHHIALSPAYLKRTWFGYPGTSSSHNILLILDS